MTIKEALVAVLKADTGVKAITTRIYPNYLPQKPTYPLIIYQRVTGTRIHHLQGPSGKAHPRFQIEAWAASQSGVDSLANAIRTALDGNNFTQGGVSFYSLIINEMDAYESDVKVHRIIMEFSIRHTE